MSIKKIECSIKAPLLLCFRTAKASDLEELSSTDIDQQWGKLKSSVKEDYEATSIMEYCHVNEHLPVCSRGLPAIDDEQAAKFAELIIKGINSSNFQLQNLILFSSSADYKSPNVWFLFFQMMKGLKFIIAKCY